VKLILGRGEPLVGRLLLYDALQMSFREFRVRRNPKCPICGERPTITGLIDYEQFCGVRGEEAPPPAAAGGPAEITVEELKGRLDRGERVFILDVRNPEEYEICRIPGSTLLPLPSLPQRFRELDAGRETVVHCKSGMRSQKAIGFLRQQGFTKLVNLKGGILAWADRIDPSVPKY
jgi:sulfur-carrier protein adenylyltransferase/sulfurtransferase